MKPKRQYLWLNTELVPAWFKDKGYTPHGSQLSAQAMSKMMGFPEDYLNPLSPYLPVTQDGSKPDTSQEEPLHQNKQRSHSIESSIFIPSNSFLGESYEDLLGSSQIFLGENSGQEDRTLQISPKKKAGDPNPSEIFLGENNQPQSSERISPKKNPSGSLYPFIQDKKDKYGNVKIYPKVVGDRSPDNPDHWFWAYCWDEKVNGKWKTFKRSVALLKLEEVRRAINADQSVSEILKIIS